MSEFPTPEMQMTHIIVVENLERSKEFYGEILGAKFFREYGGTSAVYDFQGSWILLITSGGPTNDKPDIYFAPHSNDNFVSHAFTIRVPNCQQAYEILKSRGAVFITPPYDWGGEIRCFFKDPDGNLFEISEAVS